MGIKVNLDDCIGCGVCSELCPQNFKLDEDEGKCMVIDQEVNSSAKEWLTVARYRDNDRLVAYHYIRP